MLTEDEVGDDLVGQVGAGAVIAPGLGGAPVELVGLPGELRPVLAGGQGPFAGGVEHGEVGLVELLDRAEAAAFGGLDVARARAAAEEGVADVLAQEVDVLRSEEHTSELQSRENLV